MILAPTRELVIQISEQDKKLTRHTSLRVAAVYGGAKMGEQINALRRGVDIVIATPGRLLDHLRRRNVDLGQVSILVLDEADRMLDMGFLPDMKQIIRQIPTQRQTLLFSATMSPAVLNLAAQFQHNPLHIELNRSMPPATLRQALYPVPKHLKTQLLMALFRQVDVNNMLVFTATKQEADIVTRQLRQANISVACIHGDFKQHERLAALEGFRAGRYRVLVATNVAARGLDVEGISHVINYDVPDQSEDYIHRIGRTARAEAEGDAISLVTSDDEAMINRIEHLLGHKIERKLLADFDYAVPTPSWAKPSSKAMLRQATQSLSLADRWRAMSSGRR
jgi:ATP-dependent RNA helicase RhlE